MPMKNGAEAAATHRNATATKTGISHGRSPMYCWAAGEAYTTSTNPPEHKNMAKSQEKNRSGIRQSVSILGGVGCSPIARPLQQARGGSCPNVGNVRVVRHIYLVLDRQVVFEGVESAG